MEPALSSQARSVGVSQRQPARILRDGLRLVLSYLDY